MCADIPTYFLRAASSASGRCTCTGARGGGGWTLPYSVKGLSETAPSITLLLARELRPPEVAAAAAARALATARASLALLMVLATSAGLLPVLLPAAAAACSRAALIFSRADVLPVEARGFEGNFELLRADGDFEGIFEPRGVMLLPLLLGAASWLEGDVVAGPGAGAATCHRWSAQAERGVELLIGRCRAVVQDSVCVHLCVSPPAVHQRLLLPPGHCLKHHACCLYCVCVLSRKKDSTAQVKTVKHAKF